MNAKSYSDKLQLLMKQETEILSNLMEIQEDIRREIGVLKPVDPIWGERFIVTQSSPWISEKPKLDIPNMLSKEDAQYLSWISRKVRPNSRIIELGPWLGMSTNLIARNLSQENQFVVVDDFIWRSSWMDPYYKNHNLQNGQSFKQLFLDLNSNIIDRLSIQEASIEVYDDNRHLPSFTSGEIKYDLAIIDCGRTFNLNSTWWEKLQHNFVSGETLIVLQDYGTHKEIPKKWYNQIKDFVDSKEMMLDQLHEVKNGGIASFVFMGKS